MRNLDKKKTLVVLSGGQDSATCLAYAQKNYNEVYAISFNYGQKHSIELEMAQKLSELANVKKHVIIDIKHLFDQVTSSNLMKIDGNVNESSEYDENLPSSFVPFRNANFLVQAASYAYIHNIGSIITGVCQTDFSGYPDCRQDFITALEKSLQLASESDIQIITPLMNVSKKDTVLLMKSFGKLTWYKWTHTCYNGERPPCGKCPACELRAKGFNEAKIKDPLMKLKSSDKK